jgi:hypothetical protein
VFRADDLAGNLQAEREFARLYALDEEAPEVEAEFASHHDGPSLEPWEEGHWFHHGRDYPPCSEPDSTYERPNPFYD